MPCAAVLQGLIPRLQGAKGEKMLEGLEKYVCFRISAPTRPTPIGQSSPFSS